MFISTFKDKLAASQPCIGFWIGFASAELVELAGYAGFDFVVIDAEHSVYNLETIQDMVRAAQLTQMTPIARVPKNDQETILGYLESGIQGIIVPHVNTVEAARRAVQAVKYPPLGTRGAGSSTRPANYGLTQTSAEYFAQANRQTLVITMVEEVEAVRNLAEILAVEGLDTVFIGPGDLSSSMGFPGQPRHPEVQQLVDEAKAQIRAAGKPLGGLGISGEDYRRTVARGGSFFALSLGAYLGRGLRQFLDEIRS